MVESKKPKKQRRAFHEMPLHRKQKSLSAHLHKKIREELGVRALPVRKGDTVKVLRGSFKGRTGKVSSVSVTKMHVFVEKITRKKADGTEAMVPFRASNLLIESLDKSDEKRFKRIKKLGKDRVKPERKEKPVEKNQARKSEEKGEK